MKIKVEYEIEMDDSLKKKVLAAAEEEGYDYDDAGPIETIKRMLIDVGVSGTFPEEHIDTKLWNIARLDK